MITFNQLLPPTTQRVSLNTNSNVNSQIRCKTKEALKNYNKSQFNQEQISERISKLNFEWDTERVLELNAATIVVISTFLSLRYSKYWSLLTGTVGWFLLQHAIQGWCPPVPVIRRMGIRSAEEISHEKMALKIIRKDFTENNYVSELLDSIEKQ